MLCGSADTISQLEPFKRPCKQPGSHIPSGERDDRYTNGFPLILKRYSNNSDNTQQPKICKKNPKTLRKSRKNVRKKHNKNRTPQAYLVDTYIK